ncbi:MULTISPECIES: hypothetical protein [Clostridia]|uniref:hypothetical protein n=1 Tax=Clostridia TaxID=186801 RepID=UPI00067E9831|nr:MULTISPECIES: hypothetical protein [Clostridia]
MTIELALIISIVSTSFAVFFGIKNTKRADTSDAEKKAVESATINVKLDTIAGDVRDIKYDMTAVKKDVQGLTERMIIVEQSTKSAHHRIDGIAKEREEKL